MYIYVYIYVCIYILYDLFKCKCVYFKLLQIILKFVSEY